MAPIVAAIRTGVIKSRRCGYIATGTGKVIVAGDVAMTGLMQGN